MSQKILAIVATHGSIHVNGLIGMVYLSICTIICVVMTILPVKIPNISKFFSLVLVVESRAGSTPMTGVDVFPISNAALNSASATKARSVFNGDKRICMIGATSAQARTALCINQSSSKITITWERVQHWQWGGMREKYSNSLIYKLALGLLCRIIETRGALNICSCDQPVTRAAVFRMPWYSMSTLNSDSAGHSGTPVVFVVSLHGTLAIKQQGSAFFKCDITMLQTIRV